MKDEVLAAGLCIARLGPPTEERVARTRPVVAAALERSLRLPPLGLIADVASLLASLSPSLSRTEIPGLDLRRYDDRVVGPLITHRSRPSLCDAYASLPERWQHVAVAVLAEGLCDELEPDGPWWRPAELRRWLARPAAEAWDFGVASLMQASVRTSLSERITTLTRRGTAGWSPSDVYLVRHLPSLATRAQRLAVRQVVEVAEVFDHELPRTVRPRSRSGWVSTHLEEEDRYPTGGFSALTNSGSPENLVISELVYMEDGDDLDLFDVRFTEGELLYYTRDESAHTRDRRVIHVGLASDLVGARVKDPSLPWQRMVLLLGLIQAVVGRIVAWLGGLDLHIFLHPIGPGLEEEVRLLSLVLAAPIEAGVVRISTLDAPRELVERVAQSATRSPTDVVWISSGGDAPELELEPWVLSVGEMSLPDWLAAANALAHHLS
ncbi:MAG TPA: hypothetical protein ENK18_02430 [Deltaproteobacteria bacterium]|nr:hypothetical protein [Deltaproteobacteria bacterium]